MTKKGKERGEQNLKIWRTRGAFLAKFSKFLFCLTLPDCFSHSLPVYMNL